MRSDTRDTPGKNPRFKKHRQKIFQILGLFIRDREQPRRPHRMRITQNTLRQIIKEELDAVMNEEDAMSAVADYDATMKPQGDGVVFDLDAMMGAKASFVELIKGLDADELQTLKVVLTPAHPLYDDVVDANAALAKARGE